MNLRITVAWTNIVLIIINLVSAILLLPFVIGLMTIPTNLFILLLLLIVLTTFIDIVLIMILFEYIKFKKEGIENEKRISKK